MKKIVLFACVAMLAFTSCGNKTNANTEAVDSVAEEVVAETPADSIIAVINSEIENADPATIQTTLAAVQETYAKLVEEGKLEDAKTYASAVQKFLEENSDKLNTVANGEATVSSLINGIKNLPTSAETTAEAAAAAVKSDAQSLANAAVDAAKTTAEQKVNEAKNAAVKKATEAVAPAVEKAAQVKSTADAAKAKVDEKKNQAKATVDAAKALLGK